MRKTIAWGLILSGCLSGCDVSAVINKPPAERVTKSGLKGSAGNVQTLPPKASPAKDDADTAPSSQASTENTSTTPANTDVSTPPAASEPTDAQTAAAETTLKLVDADRAEIGVIPILSDDGSVTSLRFQNDRSTITWTVEATRGPSKLTVSKVRLTLTPETWYPTPQDPFASEEAEASEAEAATEASGVEASASPQSVEVPPADLGWPTTIAAGATQALTYDANAPAIRTFLEGQVGVSRFSLTITLLAPSGEPLTNDADDTITLEQSVQVL